MILLHKVYEKLNNAAARLYTASIKRSFGSFGRGSIIYFPNTLANTEGIFVGNRVRFLSRCWIMTIQEWDGRQYGGRFDVGDNSLITYDVQISACSRITIGRNVGVGRGSVIVDHLHDYRVLDRPITFGKITEGRPIVIDDDTFIGVNSVISPGVHIGRHAFIGANSVVMESVPAYSFVAGNPARVIRHYDLKSGKWLRD